MTEREANALAAILEPLLTALEALSLIARHLHPPHLSQLMARAGTRDEALRDARAQHLSALSGMAELAALIDASCGHVLMAYEKLRSVASGDGDLRDVYQALGHVPDALETLYPLAGLLPVVNRFFIDPTLRRDEALQASLMGGDRSDRTGLMQIGGRANGAPDDRDAVHIYVPENAVSGQPLPLVMALHGGSGSGRRFIWSWVRAARSVGAIVVAPSSAGTTWSLSGDDYDTPRILDVLEFVRGMWNVDSSRMLLTGMSDGGTFAYLSGLSAGSPFTHLAPVSAAFHPMLMAFAEPDRVRGLPITVVHGELDWMFPVSMALEASEALHRAGARVRFRRLADLSHTYPGEINIGILDWLMREGNDDA